MTDQKTTPEVTVRPTQYLASDLPECEDPAGYRGVTVDYRGCGRYAVSHLNFCLGVDSTWEHEPHGDQRTDEWLAAHRFTLDIALGLARQVAPYITREGLPGPGERTPSASIQPTETLREQLLDALDFPYCQGLGYTTPEELLAAYDATREAPPAAPAVDGAALRDRVAEAALSAVETALGDTLLSAARVEALAGIAAVLPATVDQGALRDRIADVLREHYLCTNRDEADADRNMPCRCGEWREPGAEVDDENDWDSHLADAVLAVLPATTGQTAEVDRLTAELADYDRRLQQLAADRAAVLQDAAAHLDRQALVATPAAADVIRADAAELRRMADEQPAAGAPPVPVQHAPGKAIRCPDCRAKGYTVCLDEPAAGARQDGTQL